MSRLFDSLRGTVRRKADVPVLRRLEPKPVLQLPEEPIAADALPVYRSCSVQFGDDGAALPFDGHSRESEEYRLIRTRILYNRENVRILLVSSPGPGDGKTITSINLAATLALNAGNSVLLIEGDLRRPSLSALMKIPISPGLANVLSGACTLEDAIVRVEQYPNLCILPAGDALANPAELLDHERWPRLAEECRKLFGICILDGPPVECIADYALLESVSDSVVLVVRQDYTNRNLMVKALAAIPKQKFLGLILNCVTDWFLWKQPNYSYYSAKSK